MDRLKILLIYTFITNIVACKDSVSWEDYSPSSFPIDRYTPITKKGYPVTFEVYEKISDKLQLYQIENGFDSFQLRILIGDSTYGNSGEIGHIIIISCNRHSVWKATDTRYDVAVVDSGIRLNSKSVKSLAPKYWSKLARELGSLSIDSWLGSNAFAYGDYQVGNVDNMIVVEFASTTKWRRMVYVSPNTVTCNLTECKELEALLKVIINELGVIELKKYL